MKHIVEIVTAADAAPEDFANISIPDHFRGVVVRADEVNMFDGLDTASKDPRKSLHIQEVPTPEPGPGEVLVASLASAINYNTVWSAIFEPAPSIAFVKRFARMAPQYAKHDLPYQVLGSDLAGVVLRVGPGVQHWRPGDHVVATAQVTTFDLPDGHDDTMMDPTGRAWGFETNYGGLAELSVVNATQLMPKPAHLTWEEAACSTLCNSTAYRQLVSHNGAAMKQGDTVLIWGAAGGLGAYATQLAVHGGAIPVCMVSSPEKADIVRSMGAELVIDRSAEGYQFWHNGEPNPKEWKRLRNRIRELTGGHDPDIVFEHPGRETIGASVFAARHGGTIVTCAATTGYDMYYDNRYLWMSLKRIIGTHFANYREAWEANRLIALGRIHPVLSAVYQLPETGAAAYEVHRNRHCGKVGVLCLAPQEGLGVTDPETRAKHAAAINRFRRN
ncbi:crotonyl-CoA carboxylase/reductase [Nocardia arthritidis]|uniref:Crotonyl-CoA carboxylase/reductase n=1 Tax=Nocardia arthritidis TaxID=228602 RepID=A0A6G9YMG4_9NOCA|nr:crotonyl-CoA carboxylase/reductase [Nocardia arthritidis]QIS14113.1 crotonyl-CoA carboxylase/reductase [Nocardia arthritidis]